MISDATIFMGFYLGLGDFVSAVPVMRQLLRQGNRLVVALSASIAEIVQLVDLDQEKVSVVPFAPGVGRGAAHFVRLIGNHRLDRIVISPHASRVNSSWKIPWLILLLRGLYWPGCPIVGAAAQRGSRLFDCAMPVDMNLNLMHREWTMCAGAGLIDMPPPRDLTVFAPTVWEVKGDKYDVVIHPGASRSNKCWSIEQVMRLPGLLPQGLKIAFLGRNDELQPLAQLVSEYPQVRMISGSLADAVCCMARAKVAVTMDSGFSHVAAGLGMPHLALFFSTSPRTSGPVSPDSHVMFEQVHACQPCNQHECSEDQIRCLNSIDAGRVADAVRQLLSAPTVPAFSGVHEKRVPNGISHEPPVATNCESGV